MGVSVKLVPGVLAVTEQLMFASAVFRATERLLSKAPAVGAKDFRRILESSPVCYVRYA